MDVERVLERLADQLIGPSLKDEIADRLSAQFVGLADQLIGPSLKAQAHLRARRHAEVWPIN